MLTSITTFTPGITSVLVLDTWSIKQILRPHYPDEIRSMRSRSAPDSFNKSWILVGCWVQRNFVNFMKQCLREILNNLSPLVNSAHVIHEVISVFVQKWGCQVVLVVLWWPEKLQEADELQTVISSLIFHLHCSKHQAVFINIAAFNQLLLSLTLYLNTSNQQTTAQEENAADFRSKHSLIQTKRSLK